MHGGDSDAFQIYFNHTVAHDDAGHLIENCGFLVPGNGSGFKSSRVGGITIRNCGFKGYTGSSITWPLTVGQAVVINNCSFESMRFGVSGKVVGEIVENYNTFYRCGTDRINTATGANSVAYPVLYNTPILHAGADQISGFKFPWWFGELSEWSQVRAITGAFEAYGDLHSIVRPVTSGKKSWGPSQFVDMELESGTVQAGTYSRVLHDAGQVLVRRMPVTGVEITVTLYMRFEADYEPDPAGLPRMVIKQPGQADRTTMMTVAAGNWEQLTDTFTPASPPGFVEVWAESLNTAAAGNYEVFYDTMG